MYDDTFLTWDALFMAMAALVARKSKDPSTRVGAVAIGTDNEVLSVGFNGFPRGVKDDPVTMAARYERPEKYHFTVHAEANVVANASRTGTSLKGGTLYCTFMPCAPCAALLVQAGVRRVVTMAQEGSERDERWRESNARALLLLDEGGVTLDLMQPDPQGVDRTRRGRPAPGDAVTSYPCT
jgi:dCMP deaminase